MTHKIIALAITMLAALLPAHAEPVPPPAAQSAESADAERDELIRAAAALANSRAGGQPAREAAAVGPAQKAQKAK